MEKGRFSGPSCVGRNAAYRDGIGCAPPEPLVEPVPVLPLLPEAAVLRTWPAEHPFMNSALVILPSLSVSTELKSVTYGCACVCVSEPVAEASACFHNAVQSEGLVVWANAEPAQTAAAAVNPAANDRIRILFLHDRLVPAAQGRASEPRKFMAVPKGLREARPLFSTLLEWSGSRTDRGGDRRLLKWLMRRDVTGMIIRRRRSSLVSVAEAADP